MSLTEYRRKRDFEQTREPQGKIRRQSGGRLFVIQKHDASHLHYDFRLELDGVLKSWAVPKGPSLDPNQKRLAVEVEDHPVEYGSFEGLIPAGEYGGGTVLLWDRGEWEPLDDPAAGLRSGKLKFRLRGEKLQGAWMLVRSSHSHSKRPEWLLFKQPDEFAKKRSTFDVTVERPLSVATGRRLEQIAADGDRVWGRKGEAPVESRQKSAQPTASTRRASRAVKRIKRKPRADLQGTATNGRLGRAVRPPGHRKVARTGHAAPPEEIESQLATLVKRPPDGDQWLHEIKFDGYRMICHIERGSARFETRGHQDWTARFPALAEAVERMQVKQAILDGEMVVFNANGVSDFQALQAALHESRQRAIVFVVFDLFFLAGEDLRSLPLEERKRRLAALGLPTDRGPLRYSDHLVGSGPEAFAEAERQGLEGIVSKRLDRPYRSGRGTDWLKSKCQQHAEFVIGGYSNPGGARHGFGALLLGYHDGQKGLIYAGRVGTGFDERTLEELIAQLEPLEQKESPFDSFPQRSSQASGVHWVRPKLVAQITFSNWTRDQRLRHPSFQGLREDKPASQITREMPVAKLPRATKSGKALTPRAAAALKHGKRQPPKKSGKTLPPETRSHIAKQTAPATARGPQEEQIAGVRVTHPDKVLYPELGLTKRDVANYYVEHAGWILPHVVDRPLAFVRCPDGVTGERFFQKHPNTAVPAQLRRVRIRGKTSEEEYLVVDDVQGLVALVQVGALEIHVWGSRADSLERPDRLIFDLDPSPEVAWGNVISAAEEIREFLDALGLASFVKTSGGKGLHLLVPIQRRQTWQEAGEFCHLVALALERAAPDRYVSTMSKQKRTGKIFVDYLRNQRGATAVAPYSTRAQVGAAVATPIAWNELRKLRSADQYRLPDVIRRLSRLRHDPWSEVDSTRQSLTAAMLRTLRS